MYIRLTVKQNILGMKKNILQAQLIVALLVLSFFQSNAQDIQYVRKQLDRLCSPEFHGRAYYKKAIIWQLLT